MEPSEGELVHKSKMGDLVAFETLVLRYQRQVYTLSYRFMGNHEDASDLAQEAFVKVYASLQSFREEASFKTWLFHITANVCRDALRQRRRKQIVVSLDAPVPVEDGTIERQLTDLTTSPDEIYDGKEKMSYLQKFINNLPPEYRLVLVMRDVQGFSYEEIAMSVGCSPGTVKSRLNRARRTLRDKIMQHEELLAPEDRLFKERRGAS